MQGRAFRSVIARLLFRCARSGLLDAAVRFGFAHASGLLPVRRICETRDVIAFRHPRPSWSRHVLFVPKVPIRSLRAARPEQVPIVRRLIQVALDVASQEHYDRDGFTLLVNGGAHQDIGQLHVHLASWPPEAQYDCPSSLDGPVLFETDTVVAYGHPCPRRATQIVILPVDHGTDRPDSDLDDAFVDATITTTQHLVDRLDLEPGGYTLLISAPRGRARPRPCFHLVAGAERV
jgi:histidine triad (HIT) family protein